MALMEKNKYYKMNLCLVPDDEIPIQGDKFHKYYSSVDGIFTPNEKFFAQDSIVVKREGSKHLVTVVGTDIEIPCVILEIENVLNRNEYDNESNILKYSSLVVGATNKMLVAFAVSKIGDVPIMEHEEEFILREATEEEVDKQSERIIYYNFGEELQTLIDGSRAKEVRAIRTFRANLTNEIKTRMTRTIKKVLP